MASDKKIIFFGLSTCPYCKRAKEYIENKHIPVEIFYVDQLSGDERATAIEKLRGYNAALSFPTIVIVGEGSEDKCFVGFTDKAREAVDAIE